LVGYVIVLEEQAVDDGSWPNFAGMRVIGALPRELLRQLAGV